MGRLFWKFFFFIWLAQLATFFGVASLVWFKARAQEERALEISQSPPANFAVTAAASTLQYGGPDALKSLLAAGDSRRLSNVLAVDEAGREMLDRDIAPGLVDQARQMAEAAAGKPEPPRGVRQVKAKDGHTYTLFLPLPAQRGDRGGPDGGGGPPPGERAAGGPNAGAGPGAPNAGAPQGQGMGPPTGQGAGPPPNQGTGPPPNQGTGPPPNQGAGPPPNQGAGPPPNQGAGPPPGEGGPPPDERAGPPRERGERGGPPGLRSVFRMFRLPPHEPLIAGMLASLVFAALLALYIARPIRSLRDAFDGAAAGDLNTRVGPKIGARRDELADLGRDFDHMASRLQSLIEGQRRLLHDVSHEMRSPLARMQAAIGLARQGSDGAPPKPEKLVSAIERVERETTRIDALVGELLTLARLDAGVAGAAEDVNVHDLVADIVEDARFEAQGAQAENPDAPPRDIELNLAAEGTVHGRAELLHRALENVVRNAIKHTAPGTRVSVTTRVAAPGQLQVVVEDAGPGVPPAELERLFTPFFRGSNSNGSNGHGLGLAIARRVAEMHGGAIRAANRPEGGLRVEIDLPLART